MDVYYGIVMSLILFHCGSLLSLRILDLGKFIPTRRYENEEFPKSVSSVTGIESRLKLMLMASL